MYYKITAMTHSHNDATDKYNLFVIAKDDKLNEEMLTHLLEGYVHKGVGVKKFDSKDRYYSKNASIAVAGFPELSNAPRL